MSGSSTSPSTARLAPSCSHGWDGGIPASLRNCLSCVDRAGAKDKANVEVPGEHSWDRQSWFNPWLRERDIVYHLAAASNTRVCGVPEDRRAGRCTGSLSGALSIGMTLTRRSIEIKTKMGDCADGPPTRYVHDLMMAMPHKGWPV